MERTSWYGEVTEETIPGIFERLQRDFPSGTRVAWSSMVGDWSHDLNLAEIEEIKLAAPGHIIFKVTRWIFGLHAGHRKPETVEFSHDYRGTRLTVNATNGYGERVQWIFLKVADES